LSSTRHARNTSTNYSSDPTFHHVTHIHNRIRIKIRVTPIIVVVAMIYTSSRTNHSKITLMEIAVTMLTRFMVRDATIILDVMLRTVPTRRLQSLAIRTWNQLQVESHPIRRHSMIVKVEGDIHTAAAADTHENTAPRMHQVFIINQSMPLIPGHLLDKRHRSRRVHLLITTIYDRENGSERNG
jgi:hypothetical protein